MSTALPNRSKISVFYWAMQLVCIASSIAQFFIDPHPDNVTATLHGAIGSSILIQYLIRSKCAKTHPLSSLSLLGLNITSLLTSLVAMSAYGRPFIQDLRAPELTFPVLASIQVLAVATHWVYRHFTPFVSAPQAIATSIFQPIGLFSIPHVSSIWFMGAIGAFSQFIGYAETGDVGGKAVQALGFLCWMPFLIPFYYAQAGDRFCNIKRQIIFIALFIGTMALIGLARNVRQIMMIGPMQLAFAYFIYLSVNDVPSTGKTIRSLIISILVGVIGLYAASDLTTAMGVAREKRDKGTYGEVIAETANALFVERQKLDDYRFQTAMAAKTSLYDESYIPNPVLIRLSETKFHDNMLYFSERFAGDDKDELLVGMKNKAISILPDTIAKKLFTDYKKSDHIYSIGDYYLYLMWGENRLSSFVTGSVWADFYTLVGNWYFVAVIPYMLLMFITFDSLTLQNRTLLISAIGICTTWPIFIYGMGGESLVGKLAMLARELPQRILLYLILFWSLRAIQNLMGIKQPQAS